VHLGATRDAMLLHPNRVSSLQRPGVPHRHSVCIPKPAQWHGSSSSHARSSSSTQTCGCKAHAGSSSSGRASLLRPLLIDNYDSYTYNLYQIISEVYGGGWMGDYDGMPHCCWATLVQVTCPLLLHPQWRPWSSTTTQWVCSRCRTCWPVARCSTSSCHQDQAHLMSHKT
jgi:hypothetical protein